MKTHVPLLQELDQGEEKAENFKASATLYLDLMKRKTMAHWREAAVSNLPLALADPFLAPSISKVLAAILLKQGSVDEEDVQGIMDLNLPLEPSYEPILGFKLTATPEQVANRVRKTWAEEELDPTKERWWNLLEQHLPEFLQWATNGCKAAPEVTNAFTKLVTQGFAVGRLTSLIVEQGVNQMSRAGKSLAGSTSSAFATHIRLSVYEAGRRLLGLARRNVTTRQTGSKKQKTDHDTSLVTYSRGPEGSATIFRTQVVTSEYVENGQRNFENAKTKARERARTCERTRKTEELIERQLQEEEERHLRRLNDFEGKVAAAADDVVTSQASFEAFHLAALADGKYTKKMMVETLVNRYVENNAELEEKHEQASLEKLKAAELRPLMVAEFFGPGWNARVAPLNVSREMQDKAVEKAKQMCTDSLAPDGKAWAWQSL